MKIVPYLDGMGKPVVRKPMAIGATATATVAGVAAPSRLQRGLDLMSELRVPEFPPGVLPPKTDSRRKANDAQINELIGYSQQQWAGLGFMGFPFLSELSQIAEYRQASTRLAQEMVRQWVLLRSRSEQDKSQEIKDITAELARLEVQAHLRTMAEHDGMFGRGQLFPDFGPQTPAQLAAPLIYDAHTVKKGSLQRFQPIEPLYSYAYDYNASNPLDKNFYVPSTWYVMNGKINSTRLLTFISRPVPNLLKPAYAFSGMSISQLMLPTVENFLKMRQAVAGIVLNYSLRGIKTNLLGLLEGGQTNLDSIIQRIQIYTQQATNDGMLVLDKDMEDFFQHTTPMTNIDKLLDQARDNMCAVSNIPRMVMFGLSPEGMNASADGELKVFEQYVAGMQETLFRHNLTRIIQLVQLSLYGKIDPDITFEFNALREMDEKELAEIRQMNSQADNIYAAMSAVASDEVRKRLIDDPSSGWNALDASRKVVPAQPAGQGMNPTGEQENTKQGGK